MNKKTKKQLTAFIVLIAILAVGYFLGNALIKPGPLDNFARCLEENNATFYGAFWCPHCQNQKALFGSSEKHIPYVECSTPDGKGQTEECSSKDITSYPTWEFGDESRILGEVSIRDLAEKTGCELPS
ncbi:MAG: hypothetical protein O2794_03800 [bacterium]|nr:hypothetical protein [bacterium]